MAGMAVLDVFLNVSCSCSKSALQWGDVVDDVAVAAVDAAAVVLVATLHYSEGLYRSTPRFHYLINSIQTGDQTQSDTYEVNILCIIVTFVYLWVYEYPHLTGLSTLQQQYS